MLNILSLFDGISCGRIALERANIPVRNYYASEIDKDSIFISKNNYPNIIQLGNVCNINTSKLPHINILMGGSPCQSFSNAGDGSGFNGKSKLFWEFVRILKEVKPDYFLLENVKMKKEWQDIISKELGIIPIEINSSLVSAQQRKRLYWTNISNITQPKDKQVYLKDIIEKGIKKELSERTSIRPRTLRNLRRLDGKAFCMTATMWKGSQTNGMTVIDVEDKRRCLTPIECERLQNIPDNYTQNISNTKRYKCLGDGWTVDIISHILSHIPLAENSKEDGIPPTNELVGILPKRL